MNKLSPAEEEKLLRHLDGELDEVQRGKMEAELKHSPQLQKRLEELHAVHAFLANGGILETPSKNFTQKVMAGLEVQPARSVFSPRRGLILLVGIIIASGISLMLLENGVFDQTSTSLMVDNPISNKWVNIPSVAIPFNGKILINGILFLNLGLALVLLDRTILRPLFQKRASFGI